MNWDELFPATSWHPEDLVGLFTENEVRGAFFSMGSGKSPGPDGFSASFFQEFWDIIKVEIIEVFMEFLQGVLKIDRLRLCLCCALT